MLVAWHQKNMSLQCLNMSSVITCPTSLFLPRDLYDKLLEVRHRVGAVFSLLSLRKPMFFFDYGSLAIIPKMRVPFFCTQHEGDRSTWNFSVARRKRTGHNMHRNCSLYYRQTCLLLTLILQPLQICLKK